MKRIWAIGTGIILLIMLVVSYNIYLQKQITLREALRDTSALVNTVEIDIKRNFSGLEQTFQELEDYLTSPVEGEYPDPPAIRNLIDKLILENPSLTALVVLDSNGKVLHWNNNFQKLDLSQRTYFHAHKTGSVSGLYIGTPQRSIVNKNQWIFGSSKGIRNQDHSLSMVIVSIVDLKYFDHQYHSLFSTSDITLTITSPAGHIYARLPSQGELVGQKLTGFNFNPMESTIIDNDLELSIIKKVEGSPFVVSVARDKAAILATWRNTAMNFVMIGLAMSTAVLYLTYRMVIYQQRRLQGTPRRGTREIIDPLTKLFNRSHAIELAKLEIKKALRDDLALSIILIDLDHFKKVNAKYGHEKGNEVLVEAAKLLKRHCRETDTLSRFGGERFLLLLPDTALRGAVSNARKICKSLAQESYDHVSGAFSVTASFGVAQWSTEERSIAACLLRAEEALMKVKKSGRNSVLWSPRLNGRGGSSDLDILFPS